VAPAPHLTTNKTVRQNVLREDPMKKLTALIAFGAGYVFGTKAGRERYDQIRKTFRKVRNDPRVQHKAHEAADLAREKAPVVKEKASQAADKIRPDSSSDQNPAERLDREQADALNPDSTVFQSEPGPRGPLP
jgi:hypothetical protein